MLPYILRRYFTKMDQIGFEAPDRASYKHVMASTRLRVYDVINSFKQDNKYLLGWYKQKHDYRIVIFQKHFSTEAYELAKELKSRGTKIVLDINVNFYHNSEYILPHELDDAFKFTELADAVITTTEYLQKVISDFFPSKKIVVIEEAIDSYLFREEKKKFHTPCNLIWCGYSTKAKELLLISDVLKALYKNHKFTVTLITDKNPKLDLGEIPVSFSYYQHTNVPELLLQGDIFISPRDLSNIYNLGHSFTKIGVAMAVGLPVIASPIPSYAGSPAVLCHNAAEWETNLARMFVDHDWLRSLGREGRDFVRTDYSPQKIREKYKLFFDELLKW